MKVKFHNPYLSTEDKLSILQRMIIIHSVLYYVKDISVISDKDFDNICKMYLKNVDKVNIEDTDYGYMFYDFDGNTGFDLPSRLNKKDKKYIESIVFVITNKNKNVERRKKK